MWCTSEFPRNFPSRVLPPHWHSADDAPSCGVGETRSHAAKSRFALSRQPPPTQPVGLRALSCRRGGRAHQPCGSPSTCLYRLLPPPLDFVFLKRRRPRRGGDQREVAEGEEVGKTANKPSCAPRHRGDDGASRKRRRLRASRLRCLPALVKKSARETFRRVRASLRRCR